MWERLKRLLRSIFGGLIERAEDPELILQQVIRDMRDKIPQMNENVAQVMATQKLLEKEVATLEREIKELDGKIRAAIKQGRDDIATMFISAMQEKQNSMERATQELASARAASEQAKKFRDSYLLQLKKKQAEAMQLISEHKRARLQEQLAQTMASFQIGDDAATFDEMREKVARRVASAEAKIDLATSSVESEIAEIEREAFSMQVNDTLAAYKRQMGLAVEGPASSPSVSVESSQEKTLGPSEQARATE
ncbi:MAG: PspA/IM30 family protein [Acidobacteriota bacterium]|nr:PspA/IM30 family protein [Blastocatellia bacterium]MDW8239852.1 PspA/IM30 family protein [Acidobacteriota bacterium]